MVVHVPLLPQGLVELMHEVSIYRPQDFLGAVGGGIVFPHRVFFPEIRMAAVFKGGIGETTRRKQRYGVEGVGRCTQKHVHQ